MMPTGGVSATEVADATESTSRGPHRFTISFSLAVVLLIALLFRVGAELGYPSVDWPDQIFQNAEPAHRLAYGYGVVPWEFRVGLRNWVFPVFLAGVMRLTDWMGPGSLGYVRGMALTLSLVSLLIVFVGYRWGARTRGTEAAIIAALTCALWYELIYYGPKTLAEIVAGHLLVAGLYLGYWSGEAPHRYRARLIIAGILLGAVAGLRVQLGPAVVVGVIVLARKQLQRASLFLLCGIGLAVAVFGIADVFAWGLPFESYARGLWINLVEGRSSQYGVSPWYWYLGAVLNHMGPLLAFSIAGARRNPLFAAVAGTIIATYSVVPHKEYRFIVPAVMLLVILGGLGLAEALDGSRRVVSKLNVGIAVVFVALTGILGAARTFNFPARYSGALPAFERVSRDPEVCGVGTRGHWAFFGGYTYLHRNVPLVPVETEAELASLTPEFDVVVQAPGLRPPNPDYRLVRCWETACVYRRSGGCKADASHAINTVLRARNE
jgi:hypothetical protein